LSEKILGKGKLRGAGPILDREQPSGETRSCIVCSIASGDLRKVGDLMLHILENSISQIRRAGEEVFEIAERNLISRPLRLNEAVMQRGAPA
jgi:hypothetical protein